MMPLILIEFNELSPKLLRRFMDAGDLPNFSAFFASSTVFTTDAQEEQDHLEPWIQWPSVHSGMPFREHRLLHLGDARKDRRKFVAELLSDAGIRVGVFGSMNQNYRELNGYVLADPWDKAGFSQPAWLKPYYDTISKGVQESSREDALTKGELMKLAVFLARHGLTPQTVRDAVAQLLNERRDRGTKWRRASLLDSLQYDLSRYLNRLFRVQFATFFSNSTAHYQHFYWRDMEPGIFTVASSGDNQHPSLKSAILYGYRSMDRLMGRFVRDYPDALLVFCTALSQQPWTDTGKCLYRPRRFDAFFDFAQVPKDRLELKPVMSQQFHVDFRDAETAAAAERALADLAVDGQQLMWIERNGRSLFGGCSIHEPQAVLSRSIVRRSDGCSIPFGDLFYQIHTMRSGRHHPEGSLWIRNRVHRIVDAKVPLTDIAPTILAHFGVTQPDYMKGKPLAAGAITSADQPPPTR